jgi:hypothetical protein
MVLWNWGGRARGSTIRVKPLPRHFEIDFGLEGVIRVREAARRDVLAEHNSGVPFLGSAVDLF